MLLSNINRGDDNQRTCFSKQVLIIRIIISGAAFESVSMIELICVLLLYLLTRSMLRIEIFIVFHAAAGRSRWKKTVPYDVMYFGP